MHKGERDLIKRAPCSLSTRPVSCKIQALGCIAPSADDSVCLALEVRGARPFIPVNSTLEFIP